MVAALGHRGHDAGRANKQSQGDDACTSATPAAVAWHCGRPFKEVGLPLLQNAVPPYTQLRTAGRGRGKVSSPQTSASARPRRLYRKTE